jgi:hypothetical protein
MTNHDSWTNFNELPPADAADIIEHLEPEGTGGVLLEIEPPVQKQILGGLDKIDIICD